MDGPIGDARVGDVLHDSLPRFCSRVVALPHRPIPKNHRAGWAFDGHRSFEGLAFLGCGVAPLQLRSWDDLHPRAVATPVSCPSFCPPPRRNGWTAAYFPGQAQCLDRGIDFGSTQRSLARIDVNVDIRSVVPRVGGAISQAVVLSAGRTKRCETDQQHRTTRASWPLVSILVMSYPSLDEQSDHR
jgi:hypothetical protein